MVKKADQEYFGFLLGRNSYDDDDVLQQPNGNYNVGIPGYNVNFVETESDIYHFNFMGHSGSFVYNGRREVCVFNTNGRHGTYKIEYNKKDNGQIESYRGIKSFTITTEDDIAISLAMMIFLTELNCRYLAISPHMETTRNKTKMISRR